MGNKMETNGIYRIEIIALILAFLGMVLIVIFSIAFTRGQYLNINSSLQDTKRVAELGTVIGGIVGPFLSFAGVLLLYSALVHQRKEINTNQRTLNEQIEQFKGQKNELRLSRKIYENQSKILAQQSYENTFFRIIQTYLDMKDRMDHFSSENLSIIKYINNPSSNFTPTQYNEARKNLNYYFNLINEILKFLIKSTHYNLDTITYIQIFRSLMGELELDALYQVGIEEDTFYYHLEKLKFFKGINIEIVGGSEKRKYKHYKI